MTSPAFSSSLADRLSDFVQLRRLSGTDYSSQIGLLRYWDRFLRQRRWDSPHTKSLATSRECSVLLAGTQPRLSEISSPRPLRNLSAPSAVNNCPRSRRKRAWALGRCLRGWDFPDEATFMVPLWSHRRSE